MIEFLLKVSIDPVTETHQLLLVCLILFWIYFLVENLLWSDKQSLIDKSSSFNVHCLCNVLVSCM